MEKKGLKFSGEIEPDPKLLLHSGVKAYLCRPSTREANTTTSEWRLRATADDTSHE